MRCLNPRCSRELAEDWAFCDLCGHDNRPPRMRTPVDEDEHLAPMGEFCVRCGVSILDLNDPGDDGANRTQVYGGWAALALGAVLLVFSALARPNVRGKPSEAGDASLAYGAARFGSYLFAAGVILLLIAPAVRRRHRR